MALHVWLAVLLQLGASPQTASAGAAAAAQAASAGAAAPQDRWQQDVHYTIEARLDEERQVLEGAATLVYRNASPDALDRLYLHLHLNAFRPHSLWARTERRERLDFQALEDPDHAFERLGEVRLLAGAEAGGGGTTAAGADGTGLTPRYPHAPDSTVAELPLPAPIAPGDSAVLRFTWEVRPSTLCRRQCRQGRQWDLAQWYPRIAVYDRDGWQAQPLLPQGEFYGEFGTYDVTLDVAADQVVGATGVPLEGDPGWRTVAESPREEPLYRRDAYAQPLPPRSPGLLDGGVAEAPAERRRVRFYAEDVHHFAWSASPDYLYEGDTYGETALHVLYRPGDEESWGEGVALERTATALAWMEEVLGPYPWPQLTNLHRLEGGGTEFPMLIMDGSASLGLIVHETAHQWAHGILANNEWREAWLDEGMASFLTSWFSEARQGEDPWSRALESVARLDAAGRSEPIALPSAEFSDYGTYTAMSYTKASLVLRMLRGLLGEDVFRAGLYRYYSDNVFRHVREEDLRRAMEAASGKDLGWFFEQWIHTTATLDYGIEEAVTEPLPDGRWRTRVVVTRQGEAWMPVELRVGEATRLLEERERRQAVEVVTSDRPEMAELDPERFILDVDRTNQHVAVRTAGE